MVVLDGVEDPHNLGAVIRTAEAGNVSGIVVPERHSAPLSDTVAKASAGALAHVPVVRVGNLVSFLDHMKKKGVWVVGVDASGEKLWTEFDYTGPLLWCSAVNIEDCAAWFANTAMWWCGFRCWERWNP